MRSARSNSKPKRSEPVRNWQFEAIGTIWWLGLYKEPADFVGLQTAVRKRIEAYDKTYSRFRGDSLVTTISRKAGSYRLPADGKALLDLYNKLFVVTDGAVTPLIGQLLSDAGYDARYSFEQKQMRVPPAWDTAVQQRGNTITTSVPLLLDVGAVGKGHLIDIVADILRKHGVAEYVIDAGGDILQHHTSDALIVGMEHPDDAGQVIGTYRLHNQALCGSATNRRVWGKYHHIMNPHTKDSVKDIKAVWVAASSAMIADGLATSLFFVPPERLKPHFDFTFCIVDADNRVSYSPDFNGTLFT